VLVEGAFLLDWRAVVFQELKKDLIGAHHLVLREGAEEGHLMLREGAEEGHLMLRGLKGVILKRAVLVGVPHLVRLAAVSAGLRSGLRSGLMALLGTELSVGLLVQLPLYFRYALLSPENGSQFLPSR
jgi:hypothetical protein